MSQLTHKTVEEFIEVCPTYYSYNRDEFVSLIDNILTQVPEAARAAARFSVVQEPIPYTDDERADLRCVYQRPETDAELAARQVKFELDTGKQLAREKAEFERLSKKFG